MSAQHPTPWKVAFYTGPDGEPIYDCDMPIKDANGREVIVTDSGCYPPDRETVQEIIRAVNAYDILLEQKRLLAKSNAGLAAEMEKTWAEIDKVRAALENIRRFVSAWIAAGVIDKSMAKSLLVNCDAALGETTAKQERDTIGNETIPHAIIDGRRIAVLHGRVAKTPDGRIHEVVAPAPAGNAAKIREALIAARYNILPLPPHWENSSCQCEECRGRREAFRLVDSALAAPPRNCDVGTAEEQDERYRSYCSSMGCGNCPCDDSGCADCSFAWAQLPYEAPAAQEGDE